MDKPYFHLQTRQMGCSAKCFFPDCVAVLCSQWREGKLHAGMQSTSPPDTPAREEKPPDETPAQTKPAQKSLKVTSKDNFSEKFHSLPVSKLPWESRSLCRQRVSGCQCRWAHTPSPRQVLGQALPACCSPSHPLGVPTTLPPALCSSPCPKGFSNGDSAPQQFWFFFSCL